MEQKRRRGTRAAGLVDPMDPDGIADAIARILGDPALRADLVRRGHARAQAFSWERSAARTHQIYMDVLGAARG